MLGASHLPHGTPPPSPPPSPPGETYTGNVGAGSSYYTTSSGLSATGYGASYAYGGGYGGYTSGATATGYGTSYAYLGGYGGYGSGLGGYGTTYGGGGGGYYYYYAPRARGRYVSRTDRFAVTMYEAFCFKRLNMVEVYQYRARI